MRYFVRAFMAVVMGMVLTGPAMAQSMDTGNHIYANMESALSSKSANVGDQFTMTVREPYPTGYDLTGATISGHVRHVVHAGQGTKPELDLAFDRLVYSDGSSVPISANLDALDEKTQPKNGLRTAGAAVAGLLLGSAIGRTIFHIGGGGIAGAVGGFLYGQNQKADVDVPAGAAAQLTLAAPMRTRRQATQ